MNQLKKIISILLILSTFVLSIATAFPLTAIAEENKSTEEPKTASASDTTSVQISIEPTLTYPNGRAKSIGGAITLKVSLSCAPKGTVTVSYYTEDYGGARGNKTLNDNYDYQKTSGTLTFEGGQTSQEVSIKVNSTAYGTIIGTSEYNRYFRFTLCNPQSSDTGEIVTVPTPSVDCQVPCDYAYETTIINDQYYMSAYEYGFGEHTTSKNDIDGEETVTDSNVYADKSTLYESVWKKYYINKGFASAYLTLNRFHIYENYCSGNYVEFYIKSGYKTLVDFKITGVFDGNFTVSRENFTKLYTDHKAVSTYSFWWEDRYVVKDFNISGNYLCAYTGKENIKTFMIALTDTSPQYTVCLYNDNYAWDRDLSVSINTILVDNTAPTIVACYGDDSAVTDTGMFRYTLRFSEPVQVLGTNVPSIGITLGKEVVPMTYCGGSGSNALTFEVNVKNIGNTITGYYSSARLSYVDNASAIRDFGSYSTTTPPNKNGCINNTFGSGKVTISDTTSSVYKADGFVLDCRTPTLSADTQKDVKPDIESVSYRKEVRVTVKNVTQATLYYSFDDTKDVAAYNNIKTINNTDVNNEYTVSLVTENIRGEKYLHVKVVTLFGRVSEEVFYKDDDTLVSAKHGYYFSNVKPIVGTITSAGTLDYGRTFDFDVTCDLLKEGVFSSVDTLYMVVADDKFGTNAWEGIVYTSDDSDNHGNEVYKSNCEYFSCSVTQTNEKYTFHIYVRGDSAFIGLDSEDGNDNCLVYIYFYAVDSAGNNAKTSVDYKPYRFDLRSTFQTDVTYEGKSVLTGAKLQNAQSEDVTARTFDISDGSLTLTMPDELVSATSLFYIESLTIGDKSWKLSPTEEDATDETPYWKEIVTQYFTVTDTDRTIVLNPKKAGYYELVAGRAEGDDLKISYDVFNFYITNNKKDLTANYESTLGNLVLSNRLFFLNTDFWYMDDDGSYKSVNYGDFYESPAFGSADVARDYVRAMEYKDFYLVKLTEQMVTFLNNDQTTNVYIRATGETTKAKVGQWWIRYKRSSWVVPTDGSESSSASDWVYYYYCEANDNINSAIGTNLPTLLTDALEAVTERILSLGSYESLVGDYLDVETGAPYLNVQRIHVDEEEITKTMRGNTISPSVTYKGDTKIYSNTITVGKNSYPLASNLRIQLHAHSALFILKGGQYEALNIEEGVTLRSLLADYSSGVYTLLELDDTGANQFDVYLDVEAPQFTIDYVDTTSGEVVPAKFDILNDGMSVNGRSIILHGFSSEIDPMAYVAIKSNMTQSIIDVLYNEEIGEGYTLPDGSYTLEIGDRSGNIFSLTILINSDELKASATINEDRTGLSFTCSREAEEIRRFEVTLNGELLTNSYSKSKFFSKNGVYRIEIIDIYGNSKVLVESFIYKSPEVRWYYSLENDGDLIQYQGMNDDGTTMTQTTMETGEIKVLTSGYVSFIVGSEVTVEITGATEKTDYLVRSTGSAQQYTFIQKTSFTLKAYEAEYPESAVIYQCVLESTPPEFYATCRTATYSLSEYALPTFETDKNGNIITDSLIKSFDIVDGVIIPKSIDYTATETNDKEFENGSHIISNFIRVQISDDSSIRSISVVYNGIMLEEDEYQRIGDVLIFRESGDYIITASDYFGNTSTFSFRNQASTISDYWVDGIEKTQHSNEKSYGNEKIEILLKESSTILFTVCYTNEAGEEKKDFYFYSFENTLEDDDDTEKYICLDQMYFEKEGEYSLQPKNVTDGNVFLLDTEEIADSAETIYSLSSSESPYHAEIIINQDGTATIRITRTGCKLTVESRISGDSIYEPEYNQSIISGEHSDVTLKTESGVIATNQTGSIIKTKDTFTVIMPDEDTIITEISASFSTTAEFTDFTVIYNCDGIHDYSAEQNGFYLVRIINRYGNVTEYILHRSDHFSTITKAIYTDEAETSYDEYFTGTIRSNCKIIIRALGDEGEIISFFLVDENNQRTPLDVSIDADGWFTYELNTYGKTTLLLQDQYGVEQTIMCNIQEPNTIDISNLITGFPEGADSANGYSRSKLNVDKNQITTLGIGYIGIVYADNEEVLYDVLSQKTTQPDEAVFTACIGNAGDGDYILVVRDLYGNRAERVLHYHGSETLKITRTLRSSESPESIDISRIIKENGLFSNASFSFDTDASVYTLKVNGETRECPDIFSLSTTNGDYRSEYKVEYTDRYGYSYTFNAYLIRRAININLSNDVIVTSFENSNFTNSPIIAVFDNEEVCSILCTYSVDGGEELPYTSGSKLFEDGGYVFHIYDLAGNENYLSVIRDTLCEYRFSEIGVEDALLCYGVSGSSIQFASVNNDNVNIVLAKHNDKTVDVDGTSFAGNGKWEFQIQDMVGNVSYFICYIMTGPTVSFSYTTPYDYVITSIWQENGEKDGIISRISYLSSVTTENNRSSFTIADNGSYSVMMKSVYTGRVETFSFVVDDTPPDVTLVGCSDGDITTETISLRGCSMGDRVQIYRNNELVSDIIVSVDSSVADITEGGDYRIVITNEAGATTTHCFYKKNIVNTAGSLFIIIVILLLASMLMGGLLLRNKSRIDK